MMLTGCDCHFLRAMWVVGADADVSRSLSGWRFFLSVWLGTAGVAVDGRQFPLTALREIRLLKYLRHDNIVNLKEIVTGMSA